MFRVDGAQHLGLGHIMRCIAFAQRLRNKGLKPIFVIRDYEKKIAELICQYEYPVLTIPPDSSLALDASLTSNYASQYKINLIITDLSNKDFMANQDEYAKYLQGLKNCCKFLITMDGLNYISYPSDIVIIPYYGGEKKQHKSSNNTKFLLGPSYFIFRKEFIEAAKIKREIKKAAKNILITMGGSDPCGLSLKTVKALNKLNIRSLNLRIVIGIAFKSNLKQSIARALGNFKGTYEFFMGSDNMAELMLWSDLIISNGGLTKYEMAVTGTPGIVIAQDEIEAQRAKEFEKAGTVLYLGSIDEVDESAIAEATAQLLKNYELRSHMSVRGRIVVDGRGIERVISEMPEGALV